MFYKDKRTYHGLYSDCIDCHKKNYGDSYEKNKKYHQRYHKEKRKLRSERYKARRALNYAVQKGVLVRKPCEKCANPKSEGHHDDYSQALNVKWLCRLHHANYHYALRNKIA